MSQARTKSRRVGEVVRPTKAQARAIARLREVAADLAAITNDELRSVNGNTQRSLFRLGFLVWNKRMGNEARTALVPEPRLAAWRATIASPGHETVTVEVVASGEREALAEVIRSFPDFCGRFWPKGQTWCSPSEFVRLERVVAVVDWRDERGVDLVDEYLEDLEAAEDADRIAREEAGTSCDWCGAPVQAWQIHPDVPNALVCSTCHPETDGGES